MVASTVVEPDKPAFRAIVKHFSDDILQADGSLDRKKLGSIIFKDETKRKVLNQCTHPHIRKAMMWEIVKHFLKGEAALPN